MDLETTKRFEERLDRIVHLLTAIVTKDLTKKDAVLKLAGTGMAPKEIASVLSLTPNQVSVIQYDAKQAAAKQAKAPKKSAPKG